MSEQQPKYRVKETYQYCDEMGDIGAKDMQIGGNHYKDMIIQPTEFIHRNNLSFIQGNVIKYICRYKSKNGIQDLKKAKHYIDLLIEFEKESQSVDVVVTGEDLKTATTRQKKPIGSVYKGLSL